MRNLKKIIVHCSDSRFGNAALINEWHKARGWSGIGYHFVILNGHIAPKIDYDLVADGMVDIGRPVEQTGAHCEGQNADSIGVCLIGEENFTKFQMSSLRATLAWLCATYKISHDQVFGHRDFDKHGKTCPNFDVQEWWKTNQPTPL